MQPLQEALVENRLHVLLVTEKIANRHLPPQRKIDAVEIARLHARERQRGFAQGLARHRAGVDARAAEFVMAIDQRDFLVAGSWPWSRRQCPPGRRR